MNNLKPKFIPVILLLLVTSCAPITSTYTIDLVFGNNCDVAYTVTITPIEQGNVAAETETAFVDLDKTTTLQYVFSHSYMGGMFDDPEGVTLYCTIEFKNGNTVLYSFEENYMEGYAGTYSEMNAKNRTYILNGVAGSYDLEIRYNE